MNSINLGSCCACGKQNGSVQNIVTLAKRTPYGYGWGCFQCGLPMEGAIFVLCDSCLESDPEPNYFVKGSLEDGDRAPISELVEPFDHDLSKHPELSEDLNQDIALPGYNIEEIDLSDWNDPVVLYDPEYGPITDSQFTQICKEVAGEVCQMPTHYLQGGLPYCWRDEQSGELYSAVMMFVSHMAHPDKYSAPDASQLLLLRDYLKYFINAPCWCEIDGKLSELRSRVETLQSTANIDAWCRDCLEIGLDPL